MILVKKRECETNYRNLTFQSILPDFAQENDLKFIIEKIDQILANSKTNKVIAWAQTIKNANKWYEIFEKYQPLFQHLKLFKLYISHTGLSNQKSQFELNQFLLESKACMLICVARCREGFDDPKVDTVISLDPVQQRSLIVSIQKFERCASRSW